MDSSVINPQKNTSPSPSPTSEELNFEFDITCVQTRLALFWGNQDKITDGKKLAKQCERIQNHSTQNWKGKLVWQEELPGYEHMDVLWSKDRVKKVFGKVNFILSGGEQSAIKN